MLSGVLQKKSLQAQEEHAHSYRLTAVYSRHDEENLKAKLGRPIRHRRDCRPNNKYTRETNDSSDNSRLIIQWINRSQLFILFTNSSHLWIVSEMLAVKDLFSSVWFQYIILILSFLLRQFIWHSVRDWIPACSCSYQALRVWISTF